MRSYQVDELLLAETAAYETTSDRAQAMLEVLRRIVRFDGAFLPSPTRRDRLHGITKDRR